MTTTKYRITFKEVENTVDQDAYITNYNELVFPNVSNLREFYNLITSLMLPHITITITRPVEQVESIIDKHNIGGLYYIPVVDIGGDFYYNPDGDACSFRDRDEVIKFVTRVHISELYKEDEYE